MYIGKVRWREKKRIQFFPSILWFLNLSFPENLTKDKTLTMILYFSFYLVDMVRSDENEEATLLNRTNGGGPTIAPSKLSFGSFSNQVLCALHQPPLNIFIIWRNYEQKIVSDPKINKFKKLFKSRWIPWFSRRLQICIMYLVSRIYCSAQFKKKTICWTRNRIKFRDIYFESAKLLFCQQIFFLFSILSFFSTILMFFDPQIKSFAIFFSMSTNLFGQIFSLTVSNTNCNTEVTPSFSIESW